VAESTVSKQHAGRWFMRWLLEERIEEMQGPEAREGEEQLAWWQVVCLTGVDYFSPWLHTRDCGHRRRKGTEEEYARKERKQRKDNHISPGEQILILEVQVEDA
jgi:hypothetical protein